MRSPGERRTREDRDAHGEGNERCPSHRQRPPGRWSGTGVRRSKQLRHAQAAHHPRPRTRRYDDDDDDDDEAAASGVKIRGTESPNRVAAFVWHWAATIGDDVNCPSHTVRSPTLPPQLLAPFTLQIHLSVFARASAPFNSRTPAFLRPRPRHTPQPAVRIPSLCRTHFFWSHPPRLRHRRRSHSSHCVQKSRRVASDAGEGGRQAPMRRFRPCAAIAHLHPRPRRLSFIETFHLRRRSLQALSIPRPSPSASRCANSSSNAHHLPCKTIARNIVTPLKNLATTAPPRR